MNKKDLLEKLIMRLDEERKSLLEVAKNTLEAATHEESEAEDQYDTRSIEASYLAGAQARRVADLEETILAYRYMNLHDFKEGEPIRSTALVEVESEDGKITHCFLLPKGGGMTVDIEGKHIQIVTPQSPLGEALLGRKAGDGIVVDLGRESREYEILEVH